MCRTIVAILCNAASSLRSMAKMQKPQQTNKQKNKQSMAELFFSVYCSIS
jgi:hypothetical protein